MLVSELQSHVFHFQCSFSDSIFCISRTFACNFWSVISSECGLIVVVIFKWCWLLLTSDLQVGGVLGMVQRSMCISGRHWESHLGISALPPPTSVPLRVCSKSGAPADTPFLPKLIPLTHMSTTILVSKDVFLPQQYVLISPQMLTGRSKLCHPAIPLCWMPGAASFFVSLSLDRWPTNNHLETYY